MRPFALLLLALTVVYGREAQISILATTDLHGNVYPWDYLSGREAHRGLAKIATLIAAERRSVPDALLLDAGDTIQGAALETVWQTYVKSGKLPLNVRFAGTVPSVDPMMAAMNYLRYDAMTLGNHEFNFGLPNLEKARHAAKFPWLSANTSGFQGSLVKMVQGVRVGIIGLTTPAVPQWEKPENYKGHTFENPVETARRIVAELKPKTDVIVVLAHGGLESKETGKENFVHALANDVPGIDVIIYGHTHLENPEQIENGALLMQPKNWGMSLGRVDLKLESTDKGWRVASKNSRVIRVTAETPADPEVLRMTEPYHLAAEQWLKSVVAQSPVEMNGSRARIEDTPIIDAIHQVQLHYAHADVSFAASFNHQAHVAKGPVTVRDIASLYVYDNELYTIEGTGKMVRGALENAARYFLSCSDASCKGPLLNREFFGFNYDMAEGVSYDIDLSKPVGQRIRNLRFKGEPLADDRKLRIAVNNYRAAGSAGYDMFTGAPVVWRSYREIRDLMIEYYGAHPLPAAADNNWRIEPAAARDELSRETQALGGRPQTQ